jgi:hypothetical protein
MSYPPRPRRKNGHARQVALIQIKGTRGVCTGWADGFHKYRTDKKIPASVGRAGIMSVAIAGALYFKTISVNG